MKFTIFNSDILHVAKLPDVPTLENGYTPTALKKTFDRAGEEIKAFINESLIPELEDENCASRLGVKKPATLTGGSVQEVIESLAEKVQDIANASIPDAVITPEKFIPEIAGFITEGSLRAAFFTDVGEHVFIPTRTGNYKISVQGAGGGGSCAGLYPTSYGGGSGAFCVGWIWLTAGKEYRITVGEGGKGVVCDESGTLISSALEGGYSAFYDGDEELLFSEGGKVNDQSGGPAVSRGGIITRCGGFPVHSEIESNDRSHFAMGASSEFGSGALTLHMTAGIGAGGYGALRAFVSGEYVRNGGTGGNGAVLVEWVE